MRYRQSGFTAVEILLVVLVVALVGGLGWMFYDRMQSKNETTNMQQASDDTKSSVPADGCKDGDESASKGMFCAKDVGVKLMVPETFTGKFDKIKNYTVMTQSIFAGNSKDFGKSIVAYQAEIKDDKGTRSMIVSQEPLRDFKVRSFMPAMFDKDTQKITAEDGKEIESIDIDGKKFYTYGVGDAGTFSQTYAGVVAGKLLVISLRSEEQLGPNVAGEQDFNLELATEQFKSGVGNLKFL